MPKVSLPWRIFVPIVIMLGLGLTFWTGIHTLLTETQRWRDSLTAVSDVTMQTLFSEQQSFYNRLEGVEQLFLASQEVEEHEFALSSGYVTAEVPYVKGLVFFPRNTLLGRGGAVYTYPPQADVALWAKAIRAKAIDYWRQQKGPRTGLNLQMGNGESSATYRPIFASIHGTADQGVLVAFVDVAEMMTRGLLAEELSAKASLALNVSLGSKPIFTQTLVRRDMADNTVPFMIKPLLSRANAEGRLFPFTRTYHQGWAGATWSFTWAFDALSGGGGRWETGVLIFGIGLLSTILFAWVVFSQQNIAHSIQRQVVERTDELEQAGRRFRLITDNAYDLIAITNINGAFDYVNSAFHRVLGYNRDELRGQDLVTLIHPADIETVQKAMQEIIDGKSMTEYTLRIRHKRGNWMYMEAVTKALHNADWAITSLVTHCRDITARKQSADELSQSEQRFRDLANSSADWLWEVDEGLKFTYVSPGVAGVLGCTPDEMLDTKLEDLFDKENEEAKEQVISRIQRHQSYRDVEFWTRSKNNERVCLRMSGVPVFDETRSFSGYRGASTNVTASKQDRDNMYKLATTDHLTGLLNRRRFMEELERSVTLARRHGTKGVLMFIDLDRFKEINDTHGHEAGDKILTGISDILNESVRSTDIVARLGGDEFGVIMHNIPMKQAQNKMQRTVDKINSFSIDYNGAKLNVTMSIGMITYPQEERLSEDLIMSADLAMYRAKDMGRNRLYIEEDEGTDNTNIKQDSVREQLKWVERLRTCLDKGDFEMHYQPIVSVRKRQRPLFEALLRIYDKDGNVGSPALYIEAAEHFGLIQRLDLSVIERCIKTQATLQKEGVAMDVSINLSSRTLGDPEVMVALRNMLSQYDLDTARIMFEVTETVALHDPTAMRDLGEIHAFITELRGMGFRFALDDFGSGFTSFSYLRVLQLDVVKIDGEYIKNLDTSIKDKLFVESISSLAKGLGIQTVAEFIERDGVLKAVEDMGLSYAQGYLLGKPRKDIRKMVKEYTGKVVADFYTTPEFQKKAKAKKIAQKKLRVAKKASKKLKKKAS